MRPVWLMLALLVSLPAAAERRVVSGGLEASRLSNDTPDWVAAYTRADWRLDGGDSAWLQLLHGERFGLADSEISAGAGRAFGAWNLSGNLSMSQPHKVLPQLAAGLAVSRPLNGNWVLGGSYRYAQYDTDRLHLLSASVDGWFGKWNPGYTVYHGILEGEGGAYSHLLRLRYYIADFDFLGLGLLRGEEGVRLSPTAVELSAVSGVFVNGEHWWADTWALQWRLSRFAQGDFYDRTEIAIGVRRRF